LSNILLINFYRSLYFSDCANIVVHDVTIYIDSSITRVFNRSSVMYPLNTDGIDVRAWNATIYNNNITNYDDAIVAKPCLSTGKYCTCSGNIYAYNNTISYSTGLAIGSVPPNNNINCVRNVTFKDSIMYRPLKALYIKTNPGQSGSGIIEDIVYENIYIQAALWWTIWIGPQQQNQPNDNDSGTGCSFLFPFVPTCPTQPLVSIRHVTFKNIVAVDTLPVFEGPGVILCDPKNPCTDFVFSNVSNQMFLGNFSDVIPILPITVPGKVFPTNYRPDNWTFSYITTNLYGTSDSDVYPRICTDDSCFWDQFSSKNKIV